MLANLLKSTGVSPAVANRIIKILAPVWLAALITSLAAAQVTEKTPEDPPIKVETTLLNIPIIVSDRNGRNIAGLKKEDFSVYKGGVQQNIEFFANQDMSMSVAIIMDTSNSTQNVLGNIAKAAKEFLTVFRAEDQAMIVTFDNKVSVLQGFTTNQKKLRSAFGYVSAEREPGSNMNDAVYRVVTKDFASANGRKAIVVLTDGEVGGSVSSEKLLDSLIESDILVYPIFYQTSRLFPSDKKSMTYDELFSTIPGGYLNSLARATGGRLYAANGDDFSGAFQQVADELRKQYVLGIYVDSAEGSKDVKIKVNRKEAVVRCKGIIRPKKLMPPQLGKN